MVRGSEKSRTRRRVYVKTPGGNTVVHRVARKPKQASCANCGTKLPGTPRLSNTARKNIPKTAKRPERPYGGILCSKCTRQTIIKKTK